MSSNDARGTLRHLPQDLRPVACRLGEAAALQLAAVYGGKRIFVPVDLPSGHKLEQDLGRELALAVVDLLGPGHTIISRAPLAAACGLGG